jgi:hypothetical protein
MLYFVNVDKIAHDLLVPSEKGKPYVLHPVHLAASAADKRPALQADFAPATGRFSIPARTALVYVIP